MGPAEVRPFHVFSLVGLFLILWIWTEVTEYFDREAYKREVNAFMKKTEPFMAKGDRFTSEEGADLEARIEALEEQIKEGK